MKLPGRKSKKLFQKHRRLISKGVAHMAPFFIDHAKGSKLYDVDGNSYLDFASGIGTTNLGHRVPAILKAIQKASKKFLHSCFLVSPYENYLQLAEELHKLTPGKFTKKTFLANSGAEAVENAVKIARASTGRPGIISYTQSFHGRTMLTLSLTGKEKPYKVGFGPFLPHVFHFEYPKDPKISFGKINPKKIAAVIIEPVAGEGGFLVCPPGYLKNLEKFCHNHGIVFIVDEIQTGFGRTGKWFASEWSGIAPDIIVLAKSIASGMPLSAVIGKEEIMDKVFQGSLGGTFGGNPICIEAALATVKEMKRLNIPKRALSIGNAMAKTFQKITQKSPIVLETRGIGAMRALEIIDASRTKKLLKEMAEQGLLALPAGMHGNVLRFHPPLTISKKDLQKGLRIIENVIMKNS